MVCSYSSVGHGAEYQGQLIWGKTFLKRSYLKIKADFQGSLVFTNRIICKNLWKDNKEDICWWQWQQPPGKLLTEQNTNKNLIRRRWRGWGKCGGSRKDQGVCACVSNNGGNNASSKEKNIKNLMNVTGGAKDFFGMS